MPAPRRARGTVAWLAAALAGAVLAACSPDDPVAVKTQGRADDEGATTTTHAPFPTPSTVAADSTTTAPPATVTTKRARPAPTTTTGPAVTTTTAAPCGPSRDFRSYVFDLAFTPEGQGLVAGAGVRHTADGGRTWSESCVPAGPNGWVRAIAMLGAAGLAVGAGDQTDPTVAPLMLRSTDAGRRWDWISAPVSGVSLDDVAFADGRRAVAVGRRTAVDPALNPRNGTGGVVLRTEDAGLTWRVIDGLPEGVGGLRRVGFHDGDHGWALGQANSGAPVLLGTGDGGATWSPRPLPEGNFELVDVIFTDADHGWMAANEYTGQGSGVILDGLILSTSDGGATWTRRFAIGKVDGAHMWDLDIVDGHVFAIGQIVADPVVFVSADNGSTWTQHMVPGSSHTTVEFVDPLRGWVAGMRGTCTFATTDGGATWTGHSPYTSAPCNG